MTEPLKDFLSQNPSLLEAQSLPGLPHALVMDYVRKAIAFGMERREVARGVDAKKAAEEYAENCQSKAQIYHRGRYEGFLAGAAWREQEMRKGWTKVDGSCNWPTKPGFYFVYTTWPIERDELSFGVHYLRGNLEEDRFQILGNPKNLGQMHYWRSVDDVLKLVEIKELSGEKVTNE